MAGAVAVMVVMAVGVGVACRRALKCLSRVLAVSAGARMRAIGLPVPSGVGVRGGVLGRGLDADAGPGAALVRRGVGSPGEAARCSAGGAWARAAVMKMGRAGLRGRGPHREASAIGQDLRVAAEGLVLTRVSQVVAGLGAGCDPVGAHQGGVQARKRLTSAPEPVRDVGDVGGSLGDDLQGLAGGSGGRWPAGPRRRGSGPAHRCRP